MCLKAAVAAIALSLISLTAQAGDFDGPYFGLNMGYAMRALERHIPVPSTNSTAALGDLSSNGLQTGPVIGYSATFDRLYLGGEIDGAKYSAAVSAMAGLLFHDDVLFYGKFGWEYLDEKDEFGNQPQTILRSRGFAVGAGTEFKLVSHVNVRGEFTYANLDGLRSEVARARLSVIYRF